MIEYYYRFKLLLIIAILVLITSCAFNNKGTERLLRQVEGCMEAHPDSALHLLEGISEPDGLRGKVRADYFLLLTQARDKNYMDVSTDSSIVFSVDYFKKSGDKSRYGKALYYYGRVIQTKQDVTRAMKLYLDACQVLEGTEEYKILGLMHTDMSIINREQSFYDEAIHCCRQAIVYYYQAGDTLGVAYAYQTMGSSFFLKQNMDSTRWCATRSLQLLADNPTKLKSRATKLLGLTYSFEKQYARAEKIFLAILGEELDKSKLPFHYISLGRLYQMMGRKQDAEKYLKLSLDSRSLFTRSEAYACLAELAKAEHDYEQALLLKEKSDSLSYVAKNEKKRETLVQLQTEYRKEKLETERLQMKLEKRTLHFIYLVALVVLLSVFYYSYRKYWHVKLYNKQVQKVLERNNEQIVLFRKEIEMHSQQKETADTKSIREIEDLCKKIDTLVIENNKLCGKIEAGTLVKQLRQGDILAEKLSSEEWDRIFNLVDCLYFNSLDTLKSSCALLTKHDIRLLSFLLLGFSNKELMLVFDSKDGHTISKSKSRLKERLELSKDDTLDEFVKKRREGKFK